MSQSVPMVMVDLMQAAARNGSAKLLMRCEAGDKKLIDQAANKIGITTAEFLRLVVVQAAAKIMSDEGVSYEVNHSSNAQGATITETTTRTRRIKLDPHLPPGAKPDYNKM
jgi:uncharacterized protein (DUF1778 family)